MREAVLTRRMGELFTLYLEGHAKPDLVHALHVQTVTELANPPDLFLELRLRPVC
ncbi:MAG: hypothetical protein ACE15C_21485 [Phycisphaerae bacterium]